MLPQEVLGVLPPLTDARAIIAEPGPGLFHQTGFDTKIDDFTHLGNALAIHDVELNLLERWGHLVLHHLHARGVAHHFVAVLDLAGAANVETDGRVEFQRITAGRRLRVAVHHTDLHPQLVNKYNHALGLTDRPGQLAQRLAHQACLQADMAVAHLAFDLRARDQGGDRIDHQDVHRVGAHQRVADLERLLTRIGLRDDEIVDIHTKLFGIDRIERMLGIDKGGGAPLLLAFGHGVQGERGLARAFRTINLDDAALGQAANAEGNIEAERPGRNRLDLNRLSAAQFHGRALAKGAVNLRQRGVECLFAVHIAYPFVRFDDFEFGSHITSPVLVQLCHRVDGLNSMYMFCSQRTSRERGSDWLWRS